jgi:endoglycosylceramidase
VFRRAPYVLGYDPLNEPWPGNSFPTCLNAVTGCPAFEQGPLAQLEQKVTTAIRKVDRRHIVWYEPVVTANSGTPYSTVAPRGGNVGFNFHDYCLAGTADPPCGALEQTTVDNATQHAAANDDPILMSEFGATDDIPTIQRMVDRSDAAMISWQWWHYCGCDDPTTSGPGDTQALVHDPKKAPRGHNVFRAKLAALDRPYPQATAGTPTSYSYDAAANSFRLRYSTKAPSGKRLPRRVETVVYVPRLHYRSGYDVAVKGADPTSSSGARHLRLRRTKRAKTVSLTLTPR